MRLLLTSEVVFSVGTAERLCCTLTMPDLSSVNVPPERLYGTIAAFDGVIDLFGGIEGLLEAFRGNREDVLALCCSVISVYFDNLHEMLAALSMDQLRNQTGITDEDLEVIEEILQYRREDIERVSSQAAVLLRSRSGVGAGQV